MAKYILAIVLVISLLVAGEILFLHPNTPEPSYDGKSISVWLSQYDLDEPSRKAADHKIASDHAIVMMGTNAVPFLMNAHVQRDSIWQRWFYARIMPQKYRAAHYKKAYSRQEEIEHAFRALHSQASDVVPLLIAMYEKPNYDDIESGRLKILSELGNMGPLARQSIPLLLRETRSTNTFLRLDAYWALAMVHSDPEAVIPVLIRGLHDDNSRVRQYAAVGLREFGADAKAALPVLVQVEKEENTRATSWPFPIDDRAALAAVQSALVSISNASLSSLPSGNAGTQTNISNGL